MAILPRRSLEKFNFKTIQEALACVQAMLKVGAHHKALTAIMEIAEKFPKEAVPFLSLAYDIYQSFSDKSRYNLYQRLFYDFPIKEGDKVLDLGSGHIPFPLATHLADIAVEDGNVGRAGIPFKHVDGLPVYECGVEKTPFADKEFDFVYCSHVLEHTTDPQKACKELMRIAKRGYIETPTKGKDVFMHTARMSNHTQCVELINGVLTFMKYDEDIMDGLGHGLLMSMHSNPQTEREKAFSALLYLASPRINTILMWEENFEYKVACNDCTKCYNDYPHGAHVKYGLQNIDEICLELSSLCNYAILHKKCLLYSSKKHAILPAKVVYFVFQQLSEINYDKSIAYHTYNEPMIDPRLFLFTLKAKEYYPESKNRIYTNGYYLDQNLLNELPSYVIDAITINLYSKKEADRIQSLDFKKLPVSFFDAVGGGLDDRMDIYRKTQEPMKKTPLVPVRLLCLKSA